MYSVVSLLQGSDNKAVASQVLKDAVEWYKKSRINSGDLTNMWRQAANSIYVSVKLKQQQAIRKNSVIGISKILGFWLSLSSLMPNSNELERRE